MSNIIIKKKNGIRIVQHQDILFMEKNLKMILVHTIDDEFSFYGKFPDILDQLDGRFMWCHRSYMINMDKIVWMTGNEIYIVGNYHIHMGNNTIRRAKQTFNAYLEQKKMDERT